MHSIRLTVTQIYSHSGLQSLTLTVAQICSHLNLQSPGFTGTQICRQFSSLSLWLTATWIHGHSDLPLNGYASDDIVFFKPRCWASSIWMQRVRTKTVSIYFFSCVGQAAGFMLDTVLWDFLSRQVGDFCWIHPQSEATGVGANKIVRARRPTGIKLRFPSKEKASSQTGPDCGKGGLPFVRTSRSLLFNHYPEQPWAASIWGSPWSKRLNREVWLRRADWAKRWRRLDGGRQERPVRRH